MSACKVWTGTTDRDGYPVHTRRKRKVMREVFEVEILDFAQKHDLDPKDVVLRHSCDEPRCVNVDHISVGTHAMNVADKVSRNRQARGENVGPSSLTEEAVRKARRLYVRGLTLQHIADLLDAPRSTVRLAVSGETWSHIPGAVPMRRRGRRAA